MYTYILFYYTMYIIHSIIKQILCIYYKYIFFDLLNLLLIENHMQIILVYEWVLSNIDWIIMVINVEHRANIII